jgi:HEAT repeats
MSEDSPRPPVAAFAVWYDIFEMSGDSEIRMMIADYMEKGFLENIIDMFKHDRTLYPLIGELMTDERMRVRLGITALVETLAKEDPDHIALSVRGIAGLMENENPTIRGDAAYLLGIIGHRDALPFLSELLGDRNPDVEQAAREAMEEIRKGER